VFECVHHLEAKHSAAGSAGKEMPCKVPDFGAITPPMGPSIVTP